MKHTKQLPRLLMDALVVFLASVGTVFSVVTAFDLSVSPIVVGLVCAVSSLLFTGCFLWKKALVAIIPAAVLLVALGAFAGMFSSVGPTIRQLVHDILTRFSSAYPNVSFAIPQEPPAYQPQSLNLLFSLVGILLTVWMAWGVGYRSCLISVAGTLPFLLLCVIINDTPPSAGPLVLLLSAWLAVLLCKERLNEPPSMEAARLGIILMAVLLLLTIIGTVYPKEDTRDRELPQLIQDMLDLLPEPLQEMLDRDGDGFKKEELGADTSEILDLTTQGTRERKDTVMMQLSSTETGILYLRGAAKDIYTGTTWESRNAASSNLNVYAHTSLGQAFGSSIQAAVRIKNYQDDASVAFVPYGYISCSGADATISDLRLPCTEEDYITYFWPGMRGLDLVNPSGIYNAEYDEYVMDTCLDLPEGTQETLYNLALSYGYDPSLSTLDTIAWVAEFIRTIGTYRLDVSRQPTNYDFAVYFLTESREGYCVHFATAAAAMYRALGIPARYASGYRVSVKETGAVTDVTDQDTHAWAEIYLSGLGWLPIETTPGFGSSLTLPNVEHEPQPTALPEPSEEPAEPSPSQAPQQPLPSPETSPAAPSEDPNGPAPSAAPQSTSSPAAGGVRAHWYLFLAIPLGLLLLLCLVLPVRRAVVLRRRDKGFRNPDNNQAVIAQWQYLERLIPWGTDVPKELEALALKAKFSQHAITAEELAPYAEAVQHLASSTLASQRGWKKFRFVWLSCLTLKHK